jgi:enoyl-[acyl-carrier protein] reductase I
MQILQNKKGIIFGALDENSIAWKTAEEAKNEGAEIILTNFPAAIRMGKIKELAIQIDSPLIACDVAHTEEIEKLIDQSVIHFGGGIDFILHSVGMSMNIRKQNAYTSLDYEHYHTTLNISALSLHKILQTCFKKDALNEFASVVALSFIAAQRAFPNYSDMAEAKAALESIVRNFGYYYGREKNVRINSISQSPTRTSAAMSIEGFDDFYKMTNERSTLGNAGAEDCAKFICSLF